MEPAGSLVIGVLGELLKAIVDLSERSIDFNGVLEDIKSNLNSLNYAIEQLDEFSDFLDRPENTNNLREQIRKGEKLIQKCDALKNSCILIKYLTAPFYTKKLRNFDAALQTASHFLSLQLIVEQMKKQVSGSNCRRCKLRSIVDKINKKLNINFFGATHRCCCRDHHVHASPQTTLQLHFYDHNQLKGVGRRIGVLGEDRYEKNFHGSFETVGGEKLQNWFRCDFTDLSTTTTSGRPLKTKGVLYVSTQKLAFCSNKRIHNPQCKTKSLYLKVVIPFELVKGVSVANSYMEVSCVHNQVFGFTKLFNYDRPQKCLQQVPITRATCALAALF